MFYIGLYREQHKKIFFSETTRPGALIFGMWYHLVDPYQVCSNESPGAKNGPAPWSYLFVFVALRPKSTAMFIAGRSVHLTTLFPGQA